MVTDQLKARAIDIAALALIALIGWATYTGFILSQKFNALIEGQCAQVEQSVIDQEVEKATQEVRKEYEQEESQ